jgi:hypothetical protein
MKTVFWYFNDSYASVDIHTATRTLGRLGAEERRMLGESVVFVLPWRSCIVHHAAAATSLTTSLVRPMIERKARLQPRCSKYCGDTGHFQPHVFEESSFARYPRVCNTFLIFKSRTGKAMCDQRAR